MVLDKFKTFNRVRLAGFLQKPKFYGISGRVFGLILSFLIIDGFKWFWMRNLVKCIQIILEFLEMLEFLEVPFIVLLFRTIH